MERSLLTIQGKRVSADLEDRVLWKKTEDEIFLLSPFMVHWSLEIQFCFHGESFGALVFLPKWAFLLGNPRGVKS